MHTGPRTEGQHEGEIVVDDDRTIAATVVENMEAETNHTETDAELLRRRGVEASVSRRALSCCFVRRCFGTRRSRPSRLAQLEARRTPLPTGFRCPAPHHARFYHSPGAIDSSRGPSKPR